MDPVSQQPQHNPYDFITNPHQPPKKSGGLGGTMLSRIVIVVGGVLVLLIAASVVVSLMGRAGQAATNSLKGVVAKQQEIIRVANLGTKDALTNDAKGFAATVSMSVNSSQQKIKEELGSVKITEQELAAEKDSDTDKLLEGAKTTNSYDRVLQETLNTLLQSYLQTLQKAYDTASDKDVKAVLEGAFNSAQALVNTSS